MGCCTSLLYGKAGASKNTVKALLTLAQALRGGPCRLLRLFWGVSRHPRLSAASH
jgi:hypothetical protein